MRINGYIIRQKVIYRPRKSLWFDYVWFEYSWAVYDPKKPGRWADEKIVAVLPTEESAVKWAENHN